MELWVISLFNVCVLTSVTYCDPSQLRVRLVWFGHDVSLALIIQQHCDPSQL